MGVVLLISWVNEKRFRKAHLPRIGWRCWCSRFSSMICLMAICGMWLETNFAERIPGLYVKAEEGSILTSDYDVSPSEVSTDAFKAAFVNQSRSVGTGALGQVEYESETLRIHAGENPNTPGWIIHRGESHLSSELGTESVSWTGEGVVRLIERMSKPITSNELRANTTDYFDEMCKEWTAGAAFKGPPQRSRSSGCGIFPRAEQPVRWLQIAMIGLPMMLLVIAIPVTAKSTMACV